jgi:hypothetical protein
MKAYIFATLAMIFLFFLWWFTGGTIWGYVKPSPAEELFAFVWENFNVGLATVFETLGNLIFK